MLGKLVEFSIKRVGGVPLRKIDDKWKVGGLEVSEFILVH